MRTSSRDAPSAGGGVLDRALFTATEEPPSTDEIDARARSGVEVFLRAYRTGQASAPRTPT